MKQFTTVYCYFATIDALSLLFRLVGKIIVLIVAGRDNYLLQSHDSTDRRQHTADISGTVTDTSPTVHVNTVWSHSPTLMTPIRRIVTEMILSCPWARIEQKSP